MTSRRLILSSGLLLLVAVVFDRHYRFFDMAIYQGAVRWWMAGGDLYSYQAPVQGLLGFTYPPFAALVLTPTALVPAGVAGWLIVALSLLALALGLRVLDGHRRHAVLLFVVVLATEPVRQTLGLGQVNLVLFGLVVLDLAVLGRAGSRWTGVGVGIATAIKLTPGLFIVHLLVTRQWRAAGTAAYTVAVLTAGTFLIAPRETMRYFGDLMWHTERVGAADAIANQSLAGLLARLSEDHTTPTLGWLALSAAAVLVGLSRAAQAHGYGDHAAALTLVGLTANLVTPVAWTHHLVFLPVALVLLARSHRPHQLVTAATCYVLCVLSPIWWFDPGEAGAVAFLAANTFVLMTVVLVWRLPLRRTGVEASLSAGMVRATL
ncbi:glycosyltransferase 87 family protein [Actinoplanes sp. NPDC051633]|uniref:glycosyltransferase 87 family protein n=1 Tax=Actinoplanes sp. NPDC051633 TaxID=3155670 RepID=UPI003415A686